MEQDAENLAGPKGKHTPNRTASRHGYQADGKKIIMGVRIGSAENSMVCRDCWDLLDRGSGCEHVLLAIIDGSKALEALKEVFADKVIIQRCQVHKERNVLGYLPKYKHE